MAARAVSPGENKMGVMPVGRLLISMSVPIMISMLVQALYNIVDSIFVAQIGENALTAVSLAFPVQNLMISIAVGTGVGVNALLSRCLGEKNYKEANNAAVNGIFLAAVSAVVFMIVGVSLSRVYFSMQTEIVEIVDYGQEYLMVCCLGAIGVFGQVQAERLLQATGKTMYSMIVQLTGALINIILDPIFIFGYFGVPAMGVMGAAIATVIGQLIAMIVGFVINVRANKEIHLQFRGFRPRAATIRSIYSVGVPSIVMGSVGSVMSYGMNTILLGFTSTAAAVFGAYFKLQSFIFMPVFGLNNGMVSILSYNYGARNRERVIRTIKLSILFAVAIMVVGFGVFQIFPAQLLAMFNASADMLAIGTVALRIISFSFLFAGFCIVCSSVFQSLGYSLHSLMTSVVRQLVFLLPAAWLLSRTGNVDNVWFAYPIAEVSSVIISALLLRYVYRKVISKIGEEEDAVPAVEAPEPTTP